MTAWHNDDVPAAIDVRLLDHLARVSLCMVSLRQSVVSYRVSL